MIKFTTYSILAYCISATRDSKKNQILNVQKSWVLATSALVFLELRIFQMIKISKRDTFKISIFSRFNVKLSVFCWKDTILSNKKFNKPS